MAVTVPCFSLCATHGIRMTTTRDDHYPARCTSMRSLWRPKFEQFPSSDGEKKFFVMVATAKPTRYYQFVGGPTFEVWSRATFSVRICNHVVARARTAQFHLPSRAGLHGGAHVPSPSSAARVAWFGGVRRSSQATTLMRNVSTSCHRT